MALLIELESAHGLSGPLYWRLNSFDQYANRQPEGASAVPAIARFRSYASEEAFRNGRNFLEEMQVSFLPSSINANMAEEAYTALREIDPSAPIAAEIKDLKRDLVAAAERVETAAGLLGQAKTRKIGEDWDEIGEEEQNIRRADAVHFAQLDYDGATGNHAAIEQAVGEAETRHKIAEAKRKAIVAAKDV